MNISGATGQFECDVTIFCYEMSCDVSDSLDLPLLIREDCWGRLNQSETTAGVLYNQSDSNVGYDLTNNLRVLWCCRSI